MMNVDMKQSNETPADSLSCKEYLEEENTEKNSSSTAQAHQVPSPTQATSNVSVRVCEHVGEVEQPTEPVQPQHSAVQDHDMPNAEEPNTVNSTQVHVDNSSAAVESTSSVYSAQNHTPWFSLFPRELCEAIQVAYVNNQAVLVESALKQQQQQQIQQQQQQVQHVLATDASGNQYIMAAPTGGATTQAAQYAYVTPDGQIITAPGQNQVIQTGHRYELRSGGKYPSPGTTDAVYCCECFGAAVCHCRRTA